MRVIALLLIVGIAFAQSPFPLIPIQEIQWVHPDSLKLA